MKMQNEILLSADQATVWTALNDPAVLRNCIPGCQSLEPTDEGGFRATAKVKVGPIAATFKGSVVLSEIVAPVSYRINGAGDGGVAGMAKGSAAVRLSQTGENETLLSYDVDALISGKLAQLGARLINGVANRMAEQFFEAFAKIIAGTASP